MIATYNQLTVEGKQQRESLEKQLVEIDKKLHRLKERFALEEIDREVFCGGLGEDLSLFKVI